MSIPLFMYVSLSVIIELYRKDEYTTTHYWMYVG